MKNQLLTLRQLDQQLSHLKKEGAYNLPKPGWVRTLRKTLGITIKQLASRLGVNVSRVVKIEMAEVEGAVTLNTLKIVAQALNCTFVYSFVPNTSLETTLKQRAQSLAMEQVKRTAHTMSLEEQTVSSEWLNQQIQDLTEELLREPWKNIWKEK